MRRYIWVPGFDLSRSESQQKINSLEWATLSSYLFNPRMAVEILAGQIAAFSNPREPFSFVLFPEHEERGKFVKRFAVRWLGDKTARYIIAVDEGSYKFHCPIRSWNFWRWSIPDWCEKSKYASGQLIGYFRGDNQLSKPVHIWRRLDDRAGEGSPTCGLA